MKVLCVAEKPSIAKSITQILSGGQFNTRASPTRFIKNYDFDYPHINAQFTVTAVAGHLLEQDFDPGLYGWNACDPFALFDAPVVTKVKEANATIKRNLRNEIRGAQMLMIWTDCDREGEHIGSEIASVCREVRRTITVKRARFSAIIAQQIHRAAQRPVELDMAQASAVEARILLDLRIGAAFTRLQTLNLKQRFDQLQGVISYGPCQFPTLGFVVSRYNQVKAFVPETFWYIYVALSREGEEDQETLFSWKRGHLFEFDVAVALYEHVLAAPEARVTKVVTKPTKKWKPLPLTTVDLQKAGSRLLKISPKNVLDIAERLYQQGFLSYPRTETDRYDPQFDFRSLIAKQTADGAWGAFATSLQNGGFNSPRRGKNDDKAHPPIHPTAYAGNLAGDEKRVYEYITRRFLASCSKDAQGLETTVDIEINGEEFSANGLTVTERNYLEVFPYDRWSDKELPRFEQGERFMPSVCELKDGQTTRPSLLTEADLVTLMDKNGIGTDATIAQHIQTIIDREYVIERMQGATKYLVPSTLGIGLVEGYNEIGFDHSLSRPELRRDTERQMVQICEGAKTKGEFLTENVEKYKDMYMRTKRDFARIIANVGGRLRGQGPTYEADFLDIGVGDGGGGGGGGGGRGNGGGGAGGWRGGRGAAARGAAPAARRGGGGRGGGAGSASVRRDDSDSDDDADYPPPAPAPRSRGTKKAPASRTAPTSSRAPMSAAAPASTSGIGDVTCECGVAAAVRTSQKDHSKGRQFYTCGADRKCNFFQWVDTVPPGPSNGAGPSTSTSSNASRAPPPSRVASVNAAAGSSRMGSNARPAFEDPEGGEGRNCKCGISAVQRQVVKEGQNKGRMFWTCSKNQDEQCGFFEWDDDGPGGGGSGSGGAGPSGAGGATCFGCGQAGHFRSECPNGAGSQAPRSRSYATKTAANAPSTSGVCYKCNQEGHWASSCPNPGGTGGGGGGGGGGSECFQCGKTGHYASACPNDGGRNPRKRGASSTGGRPAKRARSRGGSRGRGRGRGKRKASTFDDDDHDDEPWM